MPIRLAEDPVYGFPQSSEDGVSSRERSAGAVCGLAVPVERHKGTESLSAGLNERQRRFVDLVLQGKAASRAYVLAGYKARGGSAEANASRLLRNAKVSEVLRSVRQSNCERTGFGFDQFVAYLIEVMETPISRVLIDRSYLAQKLRYSEKALCVHLPDKLRAAELLARVMGFYGRAKQESPQNEEIDIEEAVLASPALEAELRKMLDRVAAKRAEDGNSIPP